uniref:Uncharacterized protein n=1 Tax=Plectus sambesii TaxID=2011161 RepID=A0A914X9A9_9BILA
MNAIRQPGGSDKLRKERTVGDGRRRRRSSLGGARWGGGGWTLRRLLYTRLRRYCQCDSCEQAAILDGRALLLLAFPLYLPLPCLTVVWWEPSVFLVPPANCERRRQQSEYCEPLLALGLTRDRLAKSTAPSGSISLSVFLRLILLLTLHVFFSRPTARENVEGAEETLLLVAPPSGPYDWPLVGLLAAAVLSGFCAIVGATRKTLSACLPAGPAAWPYYWKSTLENELIL